MPSLSVPRAAESVRHEEYTLYLVYLLCQALALPSTLPASLLHTTDAAQKHLGGLVIHAGAEGIFSACHKSKESLSVQHPPSYKR